MKYSEKKISFAGSWMTEKEEKYVLDAVRNGWYETFDKDIRLLEKTLSDYLGVKYVIPVFCCTHALHLATLVLDLKEGDEVIVTDHSWAATAHTIAYTGATCVFVDIEEQTLCIDPVAVEKAITPKTKAIMLVPNFGVPADMTRIMEIAKKYNLYVIEDAAPALGAKHKGRFCGTIGDIGCFSFQGAKMAVSGEGGVFVTNNKEIYDKALLIANMGKTDTYGRFWCDSIGYEYTMANVVAALVRAQVERIDELVEKKRKIYSWYEERLKDNPKFQLVKEKEGDFANYCYPSIFFTDAVKESKPVEVLAKLEKLNIHCRPAFPQMSRFPMYEQRFENPIAKKFFERGIVLAAALNLEEEDVDLVCKNLDEIVK